MPVVPETLRDVPFSLTERVCLDQCSSGLRTNHAGDFSVDSLGVLGGA